MVFVGAGIAVVAGLALFFAWAFGCESSDAIPNCEVTSEVVFWWGLPSTGLVLSIAGSVLGYRSRRPAPVVLVLAAACIVAWYVGVGR